MTTIDMTIPANRERVHLLGVRYYCGIYKAGMVSRTVPATRLRQMVEKATGRKFKRGDWEGMYAAVTEVLRHE